MAAGLERFNVDVFEAALPRNKKTQTPMWTCLGNVRGEYTYIMHPSDYCRIVISSTIMNDGVAVYLSSDLRIRCMLEVAIPQKTGGIFWAPTQNGPFFDTDRRAAWDTRLLTALRILWRMGSQLVQPLFLGDTVGFASTPVNNMRPYASNNKMKPSFRWLDQCPGARVKYARGAKSPQLTDDFKAHLLHYAALQHVEAERTTRDTNPDTETTVVES
jgi:hypothetical protein